MMEFKLNDKEIKKLEKFKKNQIKLVGNYKLEFRFVLTAIGRCCDVANLINDEVVDITDYSVW